ncbi:hypothetical protein WCT84_04125 [Pectobacterium brasiliense]|uniref:hypothetical protein n=1 Tax=Pectobacterium brasiliense TaxID=180957 RepID=UPI003016AD01
MHEWDRQILEEHVIARADGVYTHDEPALITLNKKTKDIYEVVFFVLYNYFEWCPVIKDRECAVPNQFWDSDAEDPDYIFKK